MLIALELLAEQRGAWNRLRNLLARPRPRLEEAVAFAARYGVIRAPVGKNGPDWAAVTELAMGGALLLPETLEPPPGVHRLTTPGFDRQVLLATACEAVKRTRMPMYRRVIGLVDPDGAYAGMLYPLLHHCTCVRVVTANHTEYERAAEDMMERLGAPVLIGDSLPSDCVLALAPGGFRAPPSETPPRCPVMLPEGAAPPPGLDIVTALRVQPPPELAKLAPPGISPHHFAAALYEHCGLDYAALGGSFVAAHGSVAGQPGNFSDIVHRIMQNADLLSLF